MAGNRQVSSRTGSFEVLGPGAAENRQMRESMVVSARLCSLCKFLELGVRREKRFNVQA